MSMTRRERLMATLQGKPVDRPAVNFYEIGGFKVNPADQDEFNIYKHPTWQPLLELANQQTDIIRMASAVRPKAHEPGGVGATLKHASLRSQFFTETDYVQNGSRFHRTIINVAGRTLTSLKRRDPQIDTLWIIEHLLKTEDDVKAYLQLPDEIFTEVLDIGILEEEDRLVGDSGIVMVETEDPIGEAAPLFSPEDYTVIAFTNKPLFHKLLEKVAKYIYARTAKIAADFPGHLWRIYGAELAGEPFLPSALFEEYVVRYTGPMVKMILEHGGFPRIHIHGRIKSAMDKIVSMGATAIDPIEPPPLGDVTLDYIRSRYGRELVLFGNIEVAALETMPPAEFEKLIRRTLTAGTKGDGRGFVLMPTSCPYGTEISPQTMANYETMVRLVSEF